MALIAIVGGAIAIKAPAAAGVMLLIAGLVGFAFIRGLWVPTGLLCILGGILALAGRHKASTSQYVGYPQQPYQGGPYPPQPYQGGGYPQQYPPEPPYPPPVPGQVPPDDQGVWPSNQE